MTKLIKKNRTLKGATIKDSIISAEKTFHKKLVPNRDKTDFFIKIRGKKSFADNFASLIFRAIKDLLSVFRKCGSSMFFFKLLNTTKSYMLLRIKIKKNEDI
jgi:hypothetical protein